ncbi:DUF2723 domain-containing protein [Chryseobacterium chendengshani]|uniref:protein O-mannosyl-transferase family n=1 Tax=Chryseobacterium sp. LJ668 TaxID=2864040 RepID=UPI001C6919DA|nr:DUF2723 domain-containing protein [Chryseobacterium sp. LJ668]MBW8524812.1 DUF2723 domain-containing protein [Chryseobacterium sp. LJ668]QYK15169.1 DUF2723 domain-containing protein [Chryseobacterium sp. LJ668]
MKSKTIPFLIFLLFFLIYYLGSFSKISFGDSIGFVLDVENCTFITHATPLSHFLYINIPIFFSKFLNIDSVLLMRLMSIIPASLTVSLVYILLKEFISEKWIAVTSTFVFGLSFTFWRSAETVEVYAFNALAVVGFLIFSIRSFKDNSQKNILLSGILLGVSFWIHIQNIMLIPAYFVLLYLLRDNRKKVLLSLASFLFIFALMFFVNHLNDIEFKYVFISKTELWINNTFSQSLFDLITDVIKSILYLIYNFHIFTLFCVAGGIYVYRNFKNEFLFLAIASLFTFGFATFYAVSDNYVYFIPFYLIFIVFAALGIKILAHRFHLKKLKFIPLFIPLIYVSCFYIVSLTEAGEKFNQEKLYKDGLRYYMLPWLHNNVGCLEFTLDHIQCNDNVEAMKEASRQFIELRKKKQSLEEIRKL